MDSKKKKKKISLPTFPKTIGHCTLKEKKRKRGDLTQRPNRAFGACIPRLFIQSGNNGIYPLLHICAPVGLLQGNCTP